MRTKILGETRLLALLVASVEGTSENPAAIRTELNAAYDEFIGKLAELIEEENSVADVLHSLFYIRVELHALQQGECYRAKKKYALLSLPGQSA